jgi:hypothetical protein
LRAVQKLSGSACQVACLSLDHRRSSRACRHVSTQHATQERANCSLGRLRRRDDRRKLHDIKLFEKTTRACVFYTQSELYTQSLHKSVAWRRSARSSSRSLLASYVRAFPAALACLTNSHQWSFFSFFKLTFFQAGSLSNSARSMPSSFLNSEGLSEFSRLVFSTPGANLLSFFID